MATVSLETAMETLFPFLSMGMAGEGPEMELFTASTKEKEGQKPGGRIRGRAPGEETADEDVLAKESRSDRREVKTAWRLSC